MGKIPRITTLNCLGIWPERNLVQRPVSPEPRTHKHESGLGSFTRGRFSVSLVGRAPADQPDHGLDELHTRLTAPEIAIAQQKATTTLGSKANGLPTAASFSQSLSERPTDRKSIPSERSLRYKCVRSIPTRSASLPTLPLHSANCCCR